MEKVKGIIIKHPTGNSHSAFDLLTHKDNKEDIQLGYQIDNCRFVNKFLETNQDYIYITSEDNGHIPEFNWIDDYVYELISKGWKLIIFNEDLEIINKE